MDINKYLKTVSIFNALSFKDLRNIYSSSDKVKYPANATIINEGDLADSLYVILSGSVQVYTLDMNDNIVILARLDEGNYFGEQAYLSNLIRTASVKALTDVELIRIKYDKLDLIFKKSNKLRRFLQNTSLERSIENLQSQLLCIDSYVKQIFTKKSLFTRTYKTTIKHFKEDEIIFKKDDAPDAVYFISSGSVAIEFNITETESNKIIINKNHMFGEVGVIYNRPRSATARALTKTSVIVISAKNFLKAIKKATKLKSLVLAYSNTYTLPKHKGVVEQFVGKFQDSEAILTKYKLHTGKVAVCAKIVNQPMFTMKISDVEPDNTLNFKRGELIERTISFKDNIIVSITSFGEWDELNVLCEMLLDQVKVHGNYNENFSKSGNILSLSSNSKYLNEDIICNCMVISYQTLKEKIDQGCNDFDQLSFETGAATACGSCRGKILDILGKAAWCAAKIKLNQKFSDEVYSFLINPLYEKLYPFSAGQYILVKLQINGLWIERAYTLVSTKNEEYYEIIIKKYPRGAFSDWLFKHADETLFIWVSHPTGKFLLTESSKPIFCFAGGVGITPFIAFLRNIQQEHSNHHLHIFYSVTHESDAIIPDDLNYFLNMSENIKLKIWDTETKGRIDSVLVRNLMKEIEPEYIYICGSTEFENMIKQELQKMNFNQENIRTEQFLPAG